MFARSLATIASVATAVNVECSTPSSTSFADLSFLALSARGPIAPEDSYHLGAKLSPEQQCALSEVLKATVDGAIRFKVFRAESEFDDRHDCLSADDPTLPIIKFEKDSLILPACILAHGQLQTIELRITTIGNSQPPKFFEDKFGNHVLTRRNADTWIVNILPPTAFKPPNVDTSYATIDIDLSKFGLPNLIGIFAAFTLTPFDSQMGYDFYTNMDNLKVRNKYSEYIPTIADAARETEEFFGLPHGALVKQVYLVNTHTENAFFCPRDPHAIVIGDEIMSPVILIAPIARHECIHLIDHAWNISNGEFSELFTQIQRTTSGRRFLNDICEHSFLLNGTTGGHAISNSLEFFASFINGIASSDDSEWEDAMRSMNLQSKDFSVYYGRTMVVLERALIELVPPGSPLIQRFERIQTFLENHYKEQNIQSPWAPVSM